MIETWQEERLMICLKPKAHNMTDPIPKGGNQKGESLEQPHDGQTTLPLLQNLLSRGMESWSIRPTQAMARLLLVLKH
jgi:hypothetical protein